MSATTSNQRLKDWVEEWAAVMQPAEIHWCDGSDEEYERSAGRSSPPARSRSSTRPSAPTATGPLRPRRRGARRGPHLHLLGDQDDAGPTNNWRDPAEMRAEMKRLFAGSMQGRTMYVMPFSMGPLGSPIAHIGVEITDSAYVAVNMRIMTRIGQGALDVLGDDECVPCLHSVGAPLEPGEADVSVAVQRREQVHRALPRDRARSGRTAPATAATRCSARSASRCASRR